MITADACNKCGGLSRRGSIVKSMKSSNMTLDDLHSSYSSSYPSSCSSYLPFFLDKSFSTRSGLSSADCSCWENSFENFFISDQYSTSSSFSYEKDPENVGNANVPSGRGVRYLRNVFSSMDNSSESEDETCTSSSEMGWSFGSFWEVENGTIKKATSPKIVGEKIQKSSSTTRTITPFESNTNRTMDVLEKFGTIVGSFRKPGHHVGPSKNADCMCDNCKLFFAKKWYS